MHDIGFLLHGVQNEIFPISKGYDQEEFWVENLSYSEKCCFTGMEFQQKKLEPNYTLEMSSILSVIFFNEN